MKRGFVWAPIDARVGPWLRPAVFALPLVLLACGCGSESAPHEDMLSTPAAEKSKPEHADRGPAPAQRTAAPVAATTHKLAAEGWGSLKGRFVYGGEPPEPSQPEVNKDVEVCGAHPIYYEDLVVNKQNRGIANIFVYLIAKPERVAPELVEAELGTAILHQEGCVFKPHCMIVRAGQRMYVTSGDPIVHNTRIDPTRNKPYNLSLAPKDRKRVRFQRAELLPAPVKCDAHNWMSARLLVLDHPYGTVTDDNGEFVIEMLPAGELVFVVWQEKAGHIERNERITIEAGQTTDLGEVVLSPAKFMP